MRCHVSIHKSRFEGNDRDSRFSESILFPGQILGSATREKTSYKIRISYPFPKKIHGENLKTYIQGAPIHQPIPAERIRFT